MVTIMKTILLILLVGLFAFTARAQSDTTEPLSDALRYIDAWLEAQQEQLDQDPLLSALAKAAIGVFVLFRTTLKNGGGTVRLTFDDTGRLTQTWTDQTGWERALGTLAGRPQVVVMAYTSCRFACPRLLLDMKRIEDELGDAARYAGRGAFPRFSG